MRCQPRSSSFLLRKSWIPKNPSPSQAIFPGFWTVRDTSDIPIGIFFAPGHPLDYIENRSDSGFWVRIRLALAGQIRAQNPESDRFLNLESGTCGMRCFFTYKIFQIWAQNREYIPILDWNCAWESGCISDSETIRCCTDRILRERMHPILVVRPSLSLFMRVSFISKAIPLLWSLRSPQTPPQSPQLLACPLEMYRVPREPSCVNKKENGRINVFGTKVSPTRRIY